MARPATARPPQRRPRGLRIVRALLTQTEAQALAELKLAGDTALGCSRGGNETDAVLPLRRVAAVPRDVGA